MKAAIITDQHFGARNDSLQFLDFFEKFYSGTFFPTIDERKIDTLFILGDTFDRRKYVNFYSLQRSKEMFFDPLAERNITVYMLVGNHDTYYKNTNDVNSPELLLEDYTNIHIISNPQTIHLDYADVKSDVLMMPWICSENYEMSMTELKNSSATVCMGHFEIEGFQMYRGAPSHDGLSAKMFDKFDMVFSGHYHHKSSNKNIHYLGNPYEMTWQDYSDPRGFHIFDIKSHELEFIRNPHSIFKKIIYDDKTDDIKTISGWDLEEYQSCYVKIVVVNKTNPYLFDVLINNLYKAGVIDISIAEDIVELGEDDDVVDQTEDTTTILNKFIDNIETDLDKSKIKNIMRELYLEALNGEY